MLGESEFWQRCRIRIPGGVGWDIDSGVIHGVFVSDMTTWCGVTVGKPENGWERVPGGRAQDVSCQRCNRKPKNLATPRWRM